MEIICGVDPIGDLINFIPMLFYEYFRTIFIDIFEFICENLHHVDIIDFQVFFRNHSTLINDRLSVYSVD